MKNLLNCHSIGLHSFPISLENGLYRRVFYADFNHNLWRPIEIAIHPHHVDIKITVLDGVLFNSIFEVNQDGDLRYGAFEWNSHILNGNGGFEKLGEQSLKLVSNIPYITGESFSMQSCELHTVFVERGKKAVWIVDESLQTCGYSAINYSPYDLTKWTPKGLYQEVGDEVKEHYLSPYTHLIS